MFEEEFVSVIIDTLAMTEENPDCYVENARIWSNLVNHLINANQIINIPLLIQQIADKVKYMILDLI